MHKRIKRFGLAWPLILLVSAAHGQASFYRDLLERARANCAKIREERGESFKMKGFFDRLNRIDSIPIALARWEMTGNDADIRRFLEGAQ